MKILFALIALSLVIFAIMFGSLELERIKNSTLDESMIEVVNPEECDLQKRDCYFQIPNVGRFEFSIGPRPIEMNQKINLSLIVDDHNFEKVEVDFLGEEMNMGYNRPLLNRFDNKTYKGTSILPRCTTPKMTWQATVIIYTKDKTYGVPFKFLTVNK